MLDFNKRLVFQRVRIVFRYKPVCLLGRLHSRAFQE